MLIQYILRVPTLRRVARSHDRNLLFQSTHKIQSSQGPLVLNLQQTPKLLQPLVKDWSPQAFVVSFKLETDVNIISKKARESLNKNSHQVSFLYW